MTKLQLYKKLKQEVRKDLQKFSSIALAASKGKIINEKEWRYSVGDISDLVRDYIEILRDKVKIEEIEEFLYSRDTEQRDLISGKVWKLVNKLEQECLIS